MSNNNSTFLYTEFPTEHKKELYVFSTVLDKRSTVFHPRTCIFSTGTKGLRSCFPNSVLHIIYWHFSRYGIHILSNL